MEVDRERLADALPAYDIGGVVGKGGWGVVFAGRHRQLDRRVAIKQLPREFTADVAARRRFTAEARVLASLDHPHVVPVYDFVEREDLCLLVMELLPGGTVRQRFATTGFTQPEAVAVCLACAAGLNAAHQRGVLHRDVKPENMLFAASGAVKVTDFGIAKVVGGSETMLTRAGDVIGTPSYIAPEQVRGQALTPATDVYGLATMLYEVLSGALPFPHDGDAMSLMFRHAYERPVPLGDVAPNVPEPVTAVVMCGLATEPGERFATAEAFGVALAEAGTEAWGPGWLSADGMPALLGAERIVAPTRHPQGRMDTPWTVRSKRAAPVPPASGDAAVTAAPRRPVDGSAGSDRTPSRRQSVEPEAGDVHPPGVPAAPVGRADGEQGASPADHSDGTTAPARPRRVVRAVAVVALLILLVIAAVLLLPRVFTIYASAAGEHPGGPLGTVTAAVSGTDPPAAARAGSP